MLKTSIYIIPFLFLLNSFAFGNLIRPSDGDELNYIHVLFEWEQQPDAIGYNLQVSAQQFFNNLILDVDVTSTIYIDTAHFNWNDNYYWRLRTIIDCDGCEYGDWIGTSSFSIGQRSYQYIDADIYQENLLEDGYIAIGAFGPYAYSVIIDKNGDEIWNDVDF